MKRLENPADEAQATARAALRLAEWCFLRLERVMPGAAQECLDTLDIAPPGAFNPKLPAEIRAHLLKIDERSRELMRRPLQRIVDHAAQEEEDDL